jgi:hypothetical protein
MTDTPPPAVLHGVPVAVHATFVDRNDGTHRLVAAGPFLRCLEHAGTVERDNVADALAALSHARTCDRYRTAWQRLMLADDDAFTPVVRMLPKPLLSYLRDQTARHAQRLDAALAPDTPRRERRRWHNIGWRAAPSLAASYQREGVEAGIAFVAMRSSIDPEHVQAAIDDPRNLLGASLREGGHKQLRLLNLGLRPTVTDDFVYEPFEA